MSYGVHIISLRQLRDQWDWSVGRRTICISLPSLPLLSSLHPLSNYFVCLCSSIFFLLSASLCFFSRWPGWPSQCEIMVNAPWQSDTMHSPGPAPSGFNLIWVEKCVGGVMVAKGWGGKMKGWRTGCLLEGGKMKAWHVIFLPNCLTILHSSQIAISPPNI